MDSYCDEKTGVRVHSLTDGRQRDTLTYQTHPMWTPRMRHLMFSSQRTRGKWLPHACDIRSKEVRCLVDGDAEDWTLSRKNGRLFFRSGDEILSVSVSRVFRNQNGAQKIGAFDGLAAHHPISMSLDADECALYVGITLKENEQWGIAALDLSSRTWRVVAKVGFRVGHIQANPIRPGIVMFCHETGGDAPQRMWVVNRDSSGLRPFYKETYEEWVTHEVWWGADRALFTVWPYDEVHRQKPHGVMSADLATGTPTLHSELPAWHTHGSPDGRWAVADDFDRNLWLIRVDTGERRLLVRGVLGPGCETHPHPSFTPDSKAVVFNSSRFGTDRILLAELPAWENLPLP